MSQRVRRFSAAIGTVLLAALVLGAAIAPRADAAVRWPFPFLFPFPKPAPGPAPAPAIPPVGAPRSADPDTGARGTMILVHAGGWAGHDTRARDLLLKTPGRLLLDRGWRIVSIDYNDGTDGLQDVLDTAGAELERRSSSGPVCIYGESAGAHLALIAASRLSSIDCVISVGAPTDLELYEAEAAANGDSRWSLVADQIRRVFGATPEELRPWSPVTHAAGIRADVMLVREADDVIISRRQNEDFARLRPTTQLVELESGDVEDPATYFLHGTLSAAGHARYDSSIGAFADRAVVASRAERLAKRTGCRQVTRSVARGVSGLSGALRCLARKDSRTRRTSSRGWQRSSVRLRGQINAARIWTQLRKSNSGRRALAAASRRRARITVRKAARSRVILRVSRRR